MIATCEADAEVVERMLADGRAERRRGHSTSK
jgi:hypothetical protein